MNTMELASSDRRPAMQIHIPKTAGTSIRHAISTEPGDTKHVPAEDIDQGTWERHYLFAFVRNPFDRAVSMFRYHVESRYRGVLAKRIPGLKDMTFHEYVEQVIEPQDLNLAWPQVRYLEHPTSSKPVDFVGRFETLAADWKTLATELGVTGELPERLRMPPRDYRSYYEDDGLRDVIASVFEADLESLGYTFEGIAAPPSA